VAGGPPDGQKMLGLIHAAAVIDGIYDRSPSKPGRCRCEHLSGEERRRMRSRRARRSDG
jgi:hypothetical protein